MRPACSRRIGIFSSVSGGSIANGWLALTWGALMAPGAKFRDVFVPGIRDMANTTVDVWSVLAGIWTGTIPQRVAAAYDRVLFKGTKLAQLPAAPLFIYDSSNLQTGALWRFTREYMGDYKIGYIEKPDLPLSVAVGASSAFPPILSPVVLKSPGTFRPAEPPPALRDPRYRSRVTLSDGGVYDNLGLEPIIKRARTVLVSDGGSPFKTQPRPCGFWPLQIIRVLMSEDNQVRALRKRGLIDRYQLYTGLRRQEHRPVVDSGRRRDRARGHLLGHHHPCGRLPGKGRTALPGGPDRAARAHLDPPRAHEGGGPGAPDQLGLRRLRLRDPLACRRRDRARDAVALSARIELTIQPPRARAPADRS